MPRKTLIGLVGSLALWMSGILGSFALLQKYSLTAGPVAHPENAAHAALAAHHTPGRPLIAMAVHPLCPCTDSSLAELSDLLARSHGACDAVLIQFQPLNGTPEWPLDDAPRKLGGVKVPVVLDHGGNIGAALGAVTSGHTVLFDGHGEVRFHGGLTIARDHRGRSPGQDAILEVLVGRRPSLSSAPVYGCTFGPECRAEAVQ